MPTRKSIKEEIDIILKTPKVFIITAVFIFGICWLLFDRVIYKTRLDSANAIIQSKSETIKRLKTDYSNLIKFKDTVRIKDTIRIVDDKIRHVSQPKTQPTVQINGNNAVVSQGQYGGQTANTIYNQRPVARTITNYRTNLIDKLNKIEPIDYDLQVLANDMESWNLAVEIKDVFESAGWPKKPIIKGYGGIYPPGLAICRDKATKQSEEITAIFMEAGLKVAFFDDFKKEHCNKLEIFIGPNPDNYSNPQMPETHLVPREFK